MMGRAIIRRFRNSRFGQSEVGASLLEFGVVMPFMLLLMALMVEAGRFMWSYQVTLEGVREAGRYLARVAPVELCRDGGTVAGLNATLFDIVQNNSANNSLFPNHVSVNSVTATHTCVPGAFRINPTPVGTVTASLTIDFPFSGITSLFGAEMTTMTTTIQDQGRIFGQ